MLTAQWPGRQAAGGQTLGRRTTGVSLPSRDRYLEDADPRVGFALADVNGQSNVLHEREQYRNRNIRTVYDADPFDEVTVR